jgi:hypothetical protein
LFRLEPKNNSTGMARRSFMFPLEKGKKCEPKTVSLGTEKNIQVKPAHPTVEKGTSSKGIL